MGAESEAGIPTWQSGNALHIHSDRQEKAAEDHQSLKSTALGHKKRGGQRPLLDITAGL
jgi:hypothetical protein